jgi:sarcosine oxidase/L-pipecolate oxidase
VSGTAPQKAVDTMHRFKAAAEKHLEMKPFLHPISGAQDVRNVAGAWQFTGDMPGWKGYVCKYDGYVHSANALRGIHHEARKRGVGFLLGAKIGAVEKIVYEGSGKNRKSTGVQTKDGRFHAAKLVIVAVGAAAHKIVPEIGAEVSAKSWSVAHVCLNDDETAALRGIPVTYARDLGFFFEPDPTTNLLKICPMGGGYVNTNPATGISEAPEGLMHFVPKEDERRMRELLRQTLPYLADRLLVEKFICWFADTADSDFIIDYVPGTSSSVMILSGDSGHGFKMFPIVGRWVQNLLTAPDGKQSISRWRWRVPTQETKEESFDHDVSWRIGAVREIRDVQEQEALKSKM